MRKILFLLTVLVLAAVGLAVNGHFDRVRALERRLAQLEEQLAAVQSRAPAVRPGAERAPVRRAEAERPVDAAADRRLADLEAALAEVRQATDYLMERGQVPPGEAKLKELLARLGDATASERERLNALRLLRQNRAMTDEAVGSALAWLQSSGDDRLRRELLRGLDGLTNGILKQPLLQLALNEPNPAVRAEAFDNLGAFVADPAVEGLLWSRLKLETDENVRREIADALRQGPMTPERAAGLQARTQDVTASIDERLMAFRALRSAQVDISQAVVNFVNLAQTSQDPNLRARVFDAFDGMNDPSLKLPLVYGLQDANATVRERAADALSGFAADPAVQQWLRYVAENDGDPRVRREAMNALQSDNRQRPR